MTTHTIGTRHLMVVDSLTAIRYTRIERNGHGYSNNNRITLHTGKKEIEITTYMMMPARMGPQALSAWSMLRIAIPSIAEVTVVLMNQGDRVACILASVDESIECSSIVVARRIHNLLQLWKKVVGGFSIV